MNIATCLAALESHRLLSDDDAHATLQAALPAARLRYRREALRTTLQLVLLPVLVFCFLHSVVAALAMWALVFFAHAMIGDSTIDNWALWLSASEASRDLKFKLGLLPLHPNDYVQLRNAVLQEPELRGLLQGWTESGVELRRRDLEAVNTFLRDTDRTRAASSLTQFLQSPANEA